MMDGYAWLLAVCVLCVCGGLVDDAHACCNAAAAAAATTTICDSLPVA